MVHNEIKEDEIKEVEAGDGGAIRIEADDAIDEALKGVEDPAMKKKRGPIASFADVYVTPHVVDNTKIGEIFNEAVKLDLAIKEQILKENIEAFK